MRAALSPPIPTHSLGLISSSDAGAPGLPSPASRSWSDQLKVSKMMTRIFGIAHNLDSFRAAYQYSTAIARQFQCHGVTPQCRVTDSLRRHVIFTARHSVRVFQVLAHRTVGQGPAVCKLLRHFLMDSEHSQTDSEHSRTRALTGLFRRDLSCSPGSYEIAP